MLRKLLILFFTVLLCSPAHAQVKLSQLPSTSYNAATDKFLLVRQNATTDYLAPLPSVGSGTVTSVGITDNSGFFTITNSPITTSGNIGIAFSSETANLVFAAPNGSSGSPIFRSLVGADLPTPSASSLGGIQSFAAVSHQFLTSISTLGVPSAAQPAASDLSNGVTGSGAVVLATSPTITTPAINGTSTGTGVATASTASTLALRDSNGNIFSNNSLQNATATASAGGTTTLTAASSRYQALTGSSNQTFQLPDATTLTIGPWFTFNNNSSGSLIITNNGGSTIYTVPAGGIIQCGPTNIGTANGTWDCHGYFPSVVTWSSGSTGLIFNTVLSTTPQVISGASSCTSPSFIPQRGSSTTGFGGAGTNVCGAVGGSTAFTATATTFNIPSGSQYQVNGSQISCSSLSNGATGCSTATGTSGGTIPLLNGNNTWSGTNTYNGLITSASNMYISGGYVEEALFNNGNSGTTFALNLDNGPTQSLTITGAVAITLTTPTHPGKFSVIITQDATGHVYSVSGCKWPGGTALTYSTAANKVDIISIIYNGSSFYCMGGAAFS